MKSVELLNPPTMTDLLDSVKDNVGVEFNCVQIGQIQTFYPETQTADIELVIKKVESVAADGTRTYKERPILKTCPCLVLFGGTSFLSMPIATGDNCIVLFNDQEIDAWYENGGVQPTVTFRRHDISDGIALVGINSLQKSIADYVADGVRLSYSSNSRITLTDGQIESIAALFKHNGNMQITGDLIVDGNGLIKGNAHIEGGLQVDGVATGSGGGAFKMGAPVDLNGNKISGGVVSSTNGATGTFANSVTVVAGIVISGS